MFISLERGRHFNYSKMLVVIEVAKSKFVCVSYSDCQYAVKKHITVEHMMSSQTTLGKKP